ncbi:TRAP transporter fused permease subunit [Candidatus Poribacteria bacterium]|nr:TRAP transporter fused permease subunit [Candidatus Poribacteria bacterium]
MKVQTRRGWVTQPRQKVESVKLLIQKLKDNIFLLVSVVLCLFILAEVNYPQLAPQSELALFAMFGLIVVFLRYPIHPRFQDNPVFQVLDAVLIGSVIFCFGYVVAQTEPVFQGFWLDSKSLGDRAGAELALDYVVGGIGLVLVLEATRRSIGIALPLLSFLFLLYASFGQFMPDWLFPHRGYSLQRIVSQTFLHSQGTFGVALRVMFTYVFLFVLFGTLLERTGATGYVLNLARRVFGSSAGAPAKVAVLSSGMMGSLSGSAVANTATTGTFTIPLMQRAGFQPAIAGGIEAAASSGGALMPPIMGAAAYMMLEIVEPSVTYLEIIRAALLPAILYYTGMLCMVHFAANAAKDRHAHSSEEASPDAEKEDKLLTVQGGIFLAAFVTLIVFLLLGATAFRAVSWSLLVIVVISLLNFSIQKIGKQQTTTETSSDISDLRKDADFLITPCRRAAQSGVSLIAAAACVGIILGVVTLTGVGSKLPSTLLPLAATNLILALFFLMISTIILGMGLPSSVCYLLMAILVGPVLLDLGVVPLAAHFFIFYFGMMSMVTPPVALAAYAAAAIAGSGIMKTGFAAFRFALVGFALPYAFVLRPALLWLSNEGSTPALWTVVGNFSLTLVGTVTLAAAIAGYIFNKLSLWARSLLFIAALVLFFAPTVIQFVWVHGIVILASILIFYYNWREKGDAS